MSQMIGSYAFAMYFGEHYNMLGDIHKVGSTEWWRVVNIQIINAENEPVGWMLK